MPKLLIDHKEVVVPEGTNVLDAARRAGITIPHFCYHEALGSVGACRLCAVKFLEGPIKGLQMSCMIKACDGMVVSTTDQEAMKMRRMVIEWLMINHPHDCPVCDEGGECLLQEMTIAGGHARRRYRGKKRTYQNQDLGPFIHHEMNRCIQCYRCSRFYQEFAGGHDFGPLGSAHHIYFGKFEEGALESPFSGNLLDICPTGVFTDKTARYQARWWDYEMAPSICPVCSLGCNIYPVARYRKLLKIMARFNEKVNGFFICDQGRFRQDMVNKLQRIRSPLFKTKEITLQDAILIIVQRLSEMRAAGKGLKVGLLCSARATLETQILIKRLADAIGTPWISYFSHSKEEARTRYAVSLLNRENTISLREMEKTDLIVLVGVDLLTEAPMMALSIRQAYRKGATVQVIHSKRPDLPFPFQYIEAPRKEWQKKLDKILRASMKERNNHPQGRKDYKTIVMVSGVASGSEDIFQSMAQWVKSPSEDSIEKKISFLLKAPNSFGAAMLSPAKGSWKAMQEAIESNQISFLLVVEPDEPTDDSWYDIFGRLDFLAVADHKQHEYMKMAHLIIPMTMDIEMNGTYVNHEGRAQRFLKVMNPGVPIQALEPEGHPPKVFRRRAPGSEIIPAEDLLMMILQRLGQEIKDPFEKDWEKLRNLDPESSGISILK